MEKFNAAVGNGIIVKFLLSSGFWQRKR